ncbi:restriction endonuclease subunit S [Haemophilus paracuniculus]|uniref:Restriction endonuclease subunit S n=1 Tax=Haemophilus paracuniculus TaxID=734 RepID=A0A1T0AR68_9PAST|nr:restriction endonuclease subunit S [Haemophilus paracuniculus]OOR98774.1 restriction endonuclease subunit S [Haemophilus paracuniculus]
MNRYESYKNSGIEWLGEIPSHWEIGRISAFFIERRIKVSDKDFPPLSVTKLGVFPQWENVAKTNDGDNRKLVRKGDFVINSRSDRKGSSGVAKQDGSVSLINIVLQPKNINSIYSEYLFKSYGFIEEFYRVGHGIVADLWTTRFEDIKNSLISIPSISEQQKIAQYLDDKTAKIDQAIMLEEKQIEQLKEYKQSLIQNAVTKGLNPHVKFKHSGVEWIGEVPEHWDITIGMNVFKENKRDNKGMKENTVLSLSYGKIIIKSKEKLVGLVPESFETYQIVEPNDIIIRCTDLQNDQTSLRTGLAKDKGIITSAYLNLKVINNYSAKFLHYYLHTLDITKVLYKFGSGLRQNLSFLDFRRLPIVDLPFEEQHQIANYLDQQTSKIDHTIQIKQQQINKLKEYKTVLINGVVTGKVKVV